MPLDEWQEQALKIAPHVGWSALELAFARAVLEKNWARHRALTFTTAYVGHVPA